MAGERLDGPPDKSKKDDGSRINTLQILAASGASTTAAVVANLLGIYGTVIGVAVISVVSSVGTVLYLRSMHHTKERLRKVVKAAENSTARSRLRRPAPAASPPPPDDATAVIPAQTRGGEPAAETTPMPVANAADDDEPGGGLGAWWRANWKAVTVSSVLVFALSIAALSAIGWLTGSDPSAFYDGHPRQSSSAGDHTQDHDGRTGSTDPSGSDTTSREQSGSSSEQPSGGKSDRPSDQDKSTSDPSAGDEPSSDGDHQRDAPSSPGGDAEG